MHWNRQLESLLGGAHSPTGDETDAGAQLVVTQAGGQEVFRAPLARHVRVDPEQERLLWVRPIHPGGADPATGTRVYNLNLCRRRALSWTEAGVDGDAVVFALSSGQSARIEPAAGGELAELRLWDVFVLGLSAQEEEELEALSSDSWWGSHA
ncbi:hypothetical protein [Nocardiopsis sp. CNT312]|uniref:hypothetical protein n=1 Tax=Nocardiopsis sp. CNT312 TaxID=1137268 RepID=UPI00048CCA33|nr:hypothetical protein [Nocardiopsis sp. CNT312]